MSVKTLARWITMGVLICSALMSATALATELPPTVMTYLRDKDAAVKVRFDGMVTFSNGMVYLPVLPQDPASAPNPTQVTYDSGGEYPDLIQFDNNLFLIRLINTASGKLALAKLDIYPLALKEGLLPQDLLLPPNLYIPTELKVILGDIPYSPEEEAGDYETPAQLASSQFDRAASSEIPRTVYLADLERQALVAVDPETGDKREEVYLNCVVSNLLSGQEGKSVYVSCLTTDEVVVVDTTSNLVKTRISVGSRPASMALIPEQDKLAVSHRFSNFLTLVDTARLDAGAKVLLPGNGGEMVYGNGHLYISDYTNAAIYELNLTTMKPERVLPGLHNTSALWLEEAADGRPPRLWVASRTKHMVAGLDLRTGEPVANFEVGKKPVDLAPMGRKLYVVCASGDQVDVVDLDALALMAPIALTPGAFPTDISLSSEDQRAFVSAAGTDSLFVVDLHTHLVERTLQHSVRSLGLAVVGKTAPVSTGEPDLPPLEAEDKPPAL